MKTYLISDNMDTLVGLQIAGIKGKVANEKDSVLRVLNEIVKDEEIGIIIVTEKVAALVADEIKKIKLSKSGPLIIEIPDNNGSVKGENSISNYVKESIGLKI